MPGFCIADLRVRPSVAVLAMSRADVARHGEWRYSSCVWPWYQRADSWAEFNNQNKLDERDGCYFMADGELIQILEIDESGKVVGYYADKDNGRAQCWRNTYLGVVFPKPPFAPYWHRLVMH